MAGVNAIMRWKSALENNGLIGLSVEDGGGGAEEPLGGAKSGVQTGKIHIWETSSNPHPTNNNSPYDEVDCLKNADSDEDDSEAGPSSIRKFCTCVVEHPVFVGIIYTLIFVSSLSLAFESPLDSPESPTRLIISRIDYVVAVVFSLEVIMKIIAYKLYDGPNSYLRSGWNCMDIIVCSISLLGIALGGVVKSLRVIRALKAIRALRVAVILPELKIVLDTITDVIPTICMIAVVYCVLLFIVALFCMGLFKGQFRHCSGPVYSNIIAGNDSYNKLLVSPVSWQNMDDAQRSWFGPNSPFNATGPSFAACADTALSCCAAIGPGSTVDDSNSPPHLLTSRDICECWGGTWTKIIPNSFDTMYTSYLTAYELSTFCNWAEIMFAARDR